MANGFAIDPLQKTSRNDLPTFDEWPHPCWIKHQVEQVARALTRLQINKRTEELRRGFVRPDHVPIAIQDERGVRFLLEQHSIDRICNRSHFRILPGGFFVEGSIPRSEQQDIPLAQRNVQLL